MKIQCFQWDKCLIVIHANNRVVALAGFRVEQGVGSCRSAHIDPGCADIGDRRRDNGCLFAAQRAVFAGVGVERSDRQAGLDKFQEMVETYPIQGLKIYTAEWRNGSKGWRLDDPWAYRYLELCEKLGIKNLHVHKGPTIYPLDRDAFDVHDIDKTATDFPELNFIVEHVGLPRLDDFCWIAQQEINVYAGLAVAIAFIHSRPKYFAEIMANLLFWLGPDKVLFGSDYWQEVVNFEALIQHGVIDAMDVQLFQVTDSVDDAFKYITDSLSEYAAAERGAIL